MLLLLWARWGAIVSAAIVIMEAIMVWQNWPSTPDSVTPHAITAIEP
ncbi:hypothetical protein [Leptolyngbya sp. ST-U4]